MRLRRGLCKRSLMVKVSLVAKVPLRPLPRRVPALALLVLLQLLVSLVSLGFPAARRARTAFLLPMPASAVTLSGWMTRPRPPQLQQQSQ